MHSRISFVLVSMGLVACAQAESVGNFASSNPSVGTGGSAVPTSDGGSSNGGAKTSSGGAPSKGGTSGRGTAGSPDTGGDAGSAASETAGAAGKAGATSSKGGATGTSRATISAAGTSAGGGATQPDGGTAGVAGATVGASCLEKAATECATYCTGLNPGEDVYCDEVIQCWIENDCDSTDACSLNNGACSMNTQGHGATPWNQAVRTVTLCCP